MKKIKFVNSQFYKPQTVFNTDLESRFDHLSLAKSGKRWLQTNFQNRQPDFEPHLKISFVIYAYMWSLLVCKIGLSSEYKRR